MVIGVRKYGVDFYMLVFVIGFSYRIDGCWDVYIEYGIIKVKEVINVVGSFGLYVLVLFFFRVVEILYVCMYLLFNFNNKWVDWYCFIMD